MFDYYKEKDFEEIFCYFFDTYAYIYQNGFSNIPAFDTTNPENSLVSSFLNESISMLSEGFTPLMFEMALDVKYFKFYEKSTKDSEIEKLVLANNVLKFLYKKDFLSFSKTSRIWSNVVKKYAVFKTCPLLPEEHKKECLKQILGEIE